jgi:hypothetical protein
MDPLILHRKDIISRAGHFGVLKESLREAKFNSSLLSLLSELNYTIITVVIDKKKHLLKYRNQAYHPYHYCLCAMLERYTGWLRYFGQIGDVMAEARGKKEDEALADAYRRFHREGTDWMDSSVFQKHLTSKEVKLKKKEDDINGLQLADLLAHPTKQRTLLEYDAISEIAPGTFGTEVLKVVESKFNRNFRTGAIRGYGMVYL